MKKYFFTSLISLLVLASVHAQSAELAGRWQGTGSATLHSGKIKNCQEIYMEWKESDANIQLLQAGYNCGDMQAAFDPVKMEKHGSELYVENEKVGTFTTSELHLSIFNKDENFFYELTLSKKENSLQYDERWSEEGIIQMTVQGNLKKVGL